VEGKRKRKVTNDDETSCFVHRRSRRSRREVAERRKFARAENENEKEPGTEKVIDRWSKTRVNQAPFYIFSCPNGFRVGERSRQKGRERSMYGSKIESETEK